MNKRSIHIPKLWWRQWPKVFIIALGLLVYVWEFPPPLDSLGTVLKLAQLMPHDLLKVGLFYSLSLLACVRFSRLNLMTCMVLCNALLMMKAISWDKYVLPLSIIFWYLKSVGLEEGFSMLGLRNSGIAKSFSYRNRGLGTT